MAISDEDLARRGRRSDNEELYRHDLINAVTAGVMAGVRVEFHEFIEKVNTLWDERNVTKGERDSDKRWRGLMFTLGIAGGSVVGAIFSTVIAGLILWAATGKHP